ncbi:hypothetical protein [Collimonas humicola]|uniref:hypothetical protein n=1 Tax=Collimonas humicola TaxID=2825886 RepID=UPI001B8B875B|nr:hypothetical protein [Collimonas humicola]
MKQEQTKKIARLLLGYASLSDDEARHFTNVMNQFIFASSVRKRQMKECWEQEGQPVINKDNKSQHL